MAKLRFILGLWVCLTGVGCSSPGVDSSGLFELSRLDGSRVNLHPDPATRAQVFVFVSVDCPIANRCLPEIRTLADRMATNGVRFVLVYPNAEDSPAMIQKHQQEHGLMGEAYRDPEQTLARQLGAHVTPEAVAVTVDGRSIYRGRINDQYLALGRSKPAPTRHDLAEALDDFVMGKPPASLIRTPVGCSFRASP